MNKLSLIILVSLLVIGIVLSVVSFRHFSSPSADTRTTTQTPVEANLSSSHARILSYDCGDDTLHPYQLDCYWLTPDAGFPQLKLPVHVYRYLGKAPAPPLIYFGGGPGETGLTGESMHVVIRDWLGEANLQRDFVIMDMRGNARSHPALTCPGYLSQTKMDLKKNLSLAEELKTTKHIASDCYKKFAEKHFPQQSVDERAVLLSQFSTKQNAQDAALAMALLGYQTWYVSGVSYGTRVAIESALTQQAVLGLVLDSVYLPQGSHIESQLQSWSAAFERFFTSCDAQARCQKLLANNSKKAFFDAVNTLELRPMQVMSEHYWQSGEEMWMLNKDRFIGLSFLSFYQADQLVPFAELIADIRLGKLSRHPLLDQFYNAMLDPHFNDLVYYATECNDAKADAQLSDIDWQQAGVWKSRFETLLEESICDNRSFFPEPLGVSTGLIKQPALLVSGADDPVTPAAMLDPFLKDKTRYTVVKLPNQGHATFFWGKCGPTFVRDYLANLEAKSPSHSNRAFSDALMLCQSTEQIHPPKTQ